MRKPNSVLLTTARIVCQVAGQLQGRMAGDLGDVGKGSLTAKGLSRLLSRVEHNEQFVPHLYARVVAQLQRLDLCEAEWIEIDNHEDMYKEIISSQRPLHDYYRLEQPNLALATQDCSTQALSETPFVSYILQPIFREGLAVDDLQQSSQAGSTARDRWRQALLLASKAQTSDQTRGFLAKLKVLCTCTLLYPLGKCWCSNSQNHWYHLPWGDEQLEPNRTMGGSFSDLAFVVESVGALLQTKSGLSNNARTRESSLESKGMRDWVLLSLNCLAVATGALDTVNAPNRSHVEKAWKRVWTTLFRTDLPYILLTKSGANEQHNKQGDSVLRLLAQIIRFNCNGDDDGDLHNSVWTLPVFSTIPTSSSFVFVLLGIILQKRKLSETGPDVICENIRDEAPFLPVGTRRSRLIIYCTHFLRQSNQTCESSISLAAQCISALVSDSIPSQFLTSHTMYVQRPVCRLFLSSQDEELSCKDIEDSVILRLPVARVDEPLELLWGSVSTMCCPSPDETDDFTVTTAALVYSRMIQQDERPNIAESSRRKFPSDAILDTLRSQQGEIDTALGTLLILKAQMSIMLSTMDPENSEQFRTLIVLVSEVVKSVDIGEAKRFKDKAEWESALVALILVTKSASAAGVKCKTSLWDTDFAGAMLTVCRACLQFLEMYKLGNNDELAPREPTITSDENDFEHDFEPTDEPRTNDDDLVSESMKRPGQGRETMGSSTKRRRISSIPPAYIDGRTSFLLSALLLTMNPTADSFASAVYSLVGVDDIKGNECEPEGALNVIALVQLLGIFCFLPTTEGPSVPQLSFWSMQALRRSASPDSMSHFAVFRFLGWFVGFGATCPGLTPLETSDVETLVSFLVGDDRNTVKNLPLRPALRMAQLAAAHSAIRSLDSGIHREIDNIFMSTFILPFLSNLHRHVRRRTLAAMTRGMDNLDVKTAADSIRDELIPAIGKSSTYRSWYSRHLCTGEDEQSLLADVEHSVWHDARESLRHDINVLCWSTIGSSSREVRQQVLFDIAWLAARRPECQLLYYQAIEQIALRSGYENAEQLIVRETHFIVKRWIEVGSSLSDMPLVICAPGVCKKTALAGQAGLKDLPVVDQVARTMFLHRSSSNIVPVIMFESVASMVKSSRTRDCRRMLLDSNNMRDLCLACADRFDDDHVRTLLSQNYASIVAHCMSLKLSDEAAPDLSTEAMSVVKSIFSDYSQRNKENCVKICKHFICILGSDALFDAESVDFNTVFRLIHSTTNFTFNNPVELLIHARLLFASSSTFCDAELRWNVVDGLCRYGVDRACETHVNVVGLFASILVEIVENTIWETLKNRVLDTIVHISRKLIENEYASVVLKNSAYGLDLCGAMYDLHVAAQHQVYNMLEEHTHTKMNVLFGHQGVAVDSRTESRGLSRVYPTMDFSSLLDNIVKSSKTLIGPVETMRKCHNVVSLLIPSIGGHVAFMGPVDLPDVYWSYLECLAKIDPSLTIQFMIDEKAKEAAETGKVDIQVDLGLVAALSNKTAVLSQLQRVERMARARNSGYFSFLPFCVRLCKSDDSSKVRRAAARCLGEMDTQQGSNRRKRECLVDCNGEIIFAFLHAAVVDQLVTLVSDRVPRKAAIAWETLKALALCGQLESRNSNPSDIVKAVVESRESATELLKLSGFEIAAIRGCASTSEKWCWSTELWLTRSSTEQFNEWITSVATAMLQCYYKDETLISRSKFLFYCHRMCLFDARFAAKLFPLIVFHLLTDSNKNPPLADGRAELRLVSLDTWVGQASSELNGFLSQAFSSLLEHSIYQDDHRYLDLALEAIDLLRQLAQARFLSSHHHKKAGGVPEGHGVYVPYGTILRIDGKLVARGCLAAQRYEQALFYIEMFANSRFGGSSIITVASDNHDRRWLTADISGFGAHDGPEQPIDDDGDDLDTYCVLLGRVFEGLCEVESEKAVERISSRVNYCNYERDIALSTQVTQSFYKLELQDNRLNRNKKSSALKLGFLESLEDLELLNSIEAYVESLQQTETPGNLNQKHLREKIERCSLLEKTWDDTCFNADPMEDKSVAVRQQVPASSTGFFASMNGFLRNLSTGCFSAAKSMLHDLQQVCLNEFCQTGRNNSFALRKFSEQMHTLNCLEDLMNSPSDIQHILDRFSDELWRTPISENIEEATLRALINSANTEAKGSTLVMYLRSHLEYSFESCMSEARYKAAHGKLKRLCSVYQHLDTKDSDGAMERLLTFRLREARLMERRGDSSDAIISTKTAAGLLLDASTERENAVLVEAFTLCGEWTAKYKVEPASTALGCYIIPAVDMAKKMAGQINNDENQARLGRALVAQSNLANSLYEGAKTMTSSFAWKLAGEDLEKRRQKLKRQENDKNLKAGKPKSEWAEIVRATKCLREEISETSRARAELEQNMEEYRLLALDSIIASLKTGGYSEAIASKQVYRLVSIIFSCHEDRKWSSSVTEVVEKTTAVPSFRFVPLFSQVLSRLEAPNEQNQNFQNFLRNLILRVAGSHPYHCLVPLLALSEQDGAKGSAAKDLLRLLEKEDSSFVVELGLGYQSLFRGYTHLAMADVDTLDKTKTGKKISFDAVCQGKASLRLDRCLRNGSKKPDCPPCILTKPPSIQRDAKYGNGVEDPPGTERIVSFEPYFTVAPSGLSRPRIVICLGSQGGKYKQLVKGNDDTRQDSVMQQVFGYVNGLLEQPLEGERRIRQHSRDLKLVTYSVVPLSRNAGVSWVLVGV